MRSKHGKRGGIYSAFRGPSLRIAGHGGVERRRTWRLPMVITGDGGSWYDCPRSPGFLDDSRDVGLIGMDILKDLILVMMDGRFWLLHPERFTVNIVGSPTAGNGEEVDFLDYKLFAVPFQFRKEDIFGMIHFKKPKKIETFMNILLECGQCLTALIVLCGVICEYIYKADLYLFLITVGVFGWAIIQKLKHPTRRMSGRRLRGSARVSFSHRKSIRSG